MVNQPPAITSADSVTDRRSASPLDFTVTTSGYPAAALSESGTLPAGVTFTDNGNGTGHPGRHAGRRDQGELPDHHHRHQRGEPGGHPVLHPGGGRSTGPAFTSASTATFTLGAPARSRWPPAGTRLATITKKGKVPAGLTLVANGNGTDTLSGTPTKAGTSSLTLTAKNSDGTATQTLSIAVGTGPTISAKASQSVVAGHAVNDTVEDHRVTDPGHHRVGTLPTGVTFAPNTGSSTEARLSGKPAAGTEGHYVLTFTATNALGHASTSMTLTVKS